ncbi:MAG: phenylalanine--tRNA ligase alpha subunit [Patescibacteria group bacterium]|nr:MAG: phenylalanine--tRNA ligase alpha subunit [Patescibacteria group bacterium]
MDIEKYKQRFDQTIKSKGLSKSDLEELKIEYLGRKGIIRQLFSTLAELSSLDKKKYGPKINEFKNYVQNTIADIESKLEQNSKTFFDPTLPKLSFKKGSLHPITYAVEEISSIFSKIGFVRMSYNEVEWEYFSFSALNIPPDHPARDDVETFFIDYPKDKKLGHLLLSPHTSSGQVQEMLRLKQPPIRMINIAKCYRPNWDTTHTPMFHQFEGLCIDKGINITHLKGTIEYFVKHYFGQNRKIRLRPYDFRFTEPSFEIDISCAVCSGSGVYNGSNCRVCKSGWLELGGSGMVHPFVLRSGKIDPDVYSGWAFGFGVERVFLMREGLQVDDLRVFYSGDLRFLSEF